MGLRSMVRLTYQRSAFGNIARATTSGQTRTSSTISSFRKRERRTFFVGGDTLAGPLDAVDVSGCFGIVEFGLVKRFPNSTSTACKRRTAVSRERSYLSPWLSDGDAS